MNALDYFLKANLYGLLFAGCYWLFLRRHTFFSLNRAYLLLSAVFSLVLPLVSLPTQTVEIVPVPVGVIALPITVLATAPVETGPDWEQIGLMAYGFVAMVFLLRVGVRVGRLMWLIHRSPRQASDGYVRVQPNDPGIPTFSFFGYMVLNPADVQNTLIIGHEQVHIQQYHSVDVVGMALLRAVFWGCPALWLIDRLLRQVHEFLADKPTSQPTNYARFLVEYAFNLQPDTMTNGFFNPSLLKQRIQMLHQRTTTRWALGKYAVVIPLAFTLLAMTTAREEIAAIVSQSINEPIPVSGYVTSTVDKKLLPEVVVINGKKDERPHAQKKVAAVITPSIGGTITVSGRVTSAVDGKPLPGATVNGPGMFITTDADGRYKLSNVPEDASLRVSFVGFLTQEVGVNNRTTIDVSMVLKSNTLNDVVVVGFDPIPDPVLQSAIANPNSQTSPTGGVYMTVEQQPEFPGGMRALGQYLARNLRYPKEAQQTKVQGRVFVQFVVSPTGDIQNLRVLKGIGGGCDEEAVRVVSQMPKWNPGKQQGKPVAVQYNLPIQFSLEKRDDKRTGQAPTPQADSSKKTGFILDNSRNARFALYNDVSTDSKQRYSIPLPDSLRSSGSSITIRGNLLSGGDPLYIIDGVEASKSSLITLDPKNIENMTVLKNSAAAVYGPKAKYGVILITTKKK